MTRRVLANAALTVAVLAAAFTVFATVTRWR